MKNKQGLRIILELVAGMVFSVILIAFINSPNSNTFIKHYLNLFLTCMKEHSVFISFLFTIKETTV